MHLRLLWFNNIELLRAPSFLIVHFLLRKELRGVRAMGRVVWGRIPRDFSGFGKMPMERDELNLRGPEVS